MLRLTWTLGLLGVCLTGCIGPEWGDNSQPSLQIDQVVLGISDLDAGIREFEELTGVRPVRGGDHPELGTHNALVKIGNRIYLEILAPRPGAEVHESLRSLSDLDQLTPVMWAVSTSDLDRTRDSLIEAGFELSEPLAASRVQEDGPTLRFRVSEMSTSYPSSRPFLIEWDEDSPHPSESSPVACQLRWFRVIDPQLDELRRLTRQLGLGIGVEQGPQQSFAVGLDSPEGEVVIAR